MNRSIAAFGNVTDINTWSNIPWYFFKAGQKAGIFTIPWNVQPNDKPYRKWIWNINQFLNFRGIGGYQYSLACIDYIEKNLPKEYLCSEVISFNQWFPKSTTVLQDGGKTWRYIDATLKQLFDNPTYNMKLSRKKSHDIFHLERENYRLSEGVVAMSRWAAESVIHDYDIPSEKVHVILPGANMDLPAGYRFGDFPDKKVNNRPFRFAFIGKDWKRKGLSVLVNISKALVERQLRIEIVIIGKAPGNLSNFPFVNYRGFIDKRSEIDTFIEVLQSCDMGCLFSESEALGISILEFLRLGIPVAGFATQGISDTIPPDAGLRFNRKTDLEEIINVIEKYIRNLERQRTSRENAVKWSPLVSWERCIGEWKELLETGKVSCPVQPWKGLKGQYINEES